MGQAKQRGSYEQRKALAIEREKEEWKKHKEEIARKDHEADMREALLTPTQKRKRAENYAILSAFSYAPNGYFITR